MIDTRINSYIKNTKQPLILIILLRLLLLIINIVFLILCAYNICGYINNQTIIIKPLIIVFIVYIISNIICNYLIGRLSHKLCYNVKISLRQQIYNTITNNYQIVLQNNQKAQQILQLAVEGVNQLEQYFVNYLPQFFYALIAPLILFILYFFIAPSVGTILFISVWLIPIIIALSQTIAKKIMGKYWNRYLGLGLDFLENLEGLLTLKLFNADQYYQEKMDHSAQLFRKSTMRVLVMQLNSITIMDLVTYLGSGIGLLNALYIFLTTHNLFVLIITIIVAIEFFLPMRMLGSFFHVALNGISASKTLDKILQTKKAPTLNLPPITNISLNDVSIGYKQPLINNLTLNINQGILGVCGASGSGKSSFYKAIINNNLLKGSISLNHNISNYHNNDILDHIYLQRETNYIFNLSIKENFLMIDPQLSDEAIMKMLNKVGLKSLANPNGLKTIIGSDAYNFSGGEKQRLYLALGLISNKDIYIFDEAISSVDVNSETILLNLIKELSQEKIVILISHRLYLMRHCQQILYLDQNNWVIDNYDALLKNKHFNQALSLQLTYEKIGG